jgi:hypothetical protein
VRGRLDISQQFINGVDKILHALKVIGKRARGNRLAPSKFFSKQGAALAHRGSGGRRPARSAELALSWTKNQEKFNFI